MNFRVGDKIILKTRQSLIIPYQSNQPSVMGRDDYDYRSPITMISTEVYEPHTVYEVQDYDDNGRVRIKGMESYVYSENFISYKKYEFEQTLKKL